jgi:hypothetical protein
MDAIKKNPRTNHVTLVRIIRLHTLNTEPEVTL